MYTTIKEIDRSVTYKLKLIYADPLIKLKKYDGASDGIGAGLDKNGLPATGLCEPFQDAQGNKHMGTRMEMERLLSMAEGSLKQRSVFWLRYFVDVHADDITLDLSDPHDLLKFLFVSAQSIVAKGKKDAETNAKAEYILYSEEDEAKSRIKKRSAKKEAYRLSEELDPETMVNILAVYGEIADATAVNTVIDMIDQKIEENAAKFLSIAKDGTLVTQALIRKALDKGVLTVQNGGAIHHGDVVVGFDQKSAAESLQKNSKLVTIIKAKLSGDMDAIKEALKGETKAKPKVAAAKK